MPLKTAVLATVAVLVASVAQLLLRAGMKAVGPIDSARLAKPMKLVVHVATTPQVPIGFALFGISALMWLVVLSQVSISLAYPFAAITYIVTTIFDRVVLHEPVPSLRWIGLVLVIGGILVISRSAASALQ